MTEPTIVTLADPDACSLAAAERIVEILDVAIDDRGEAHWVTTGGSAPGAIYGHLRGESLRDEIDWRRVHLWWTDERFVPPDHALSNAKIADELLLTHRAGDPGGGGLPIPIDNVHPIDTSAAIAAGHGADWAAARYVEDLQADGPDTNDAGWPVFDLILLGLGPDGHILSVFPGSATFDERAWALGVPAPTHVEPHVDRVTLNPAIVPAARDLLLVTHGESKAAIVREILAGERDERRLPAQLARREGATWILDRAAAAAL
jgi:6-phosphogluconolactonase